jgi:hypothetical protein
MSKTLLEQLPEIVSNARKEAERVLENLADSTPKCNRLMLLGVV